MNKNELVTEIAEQTDVPKKTVEEVLDAFTGTVGTTLKKGDRVALTGFGTFERRDRSARTAQNPQTGERMRVKAKKVPAFKPGQGLKDVVASPRGGAKKAAGKKSSTKKAAGKKSSAKKAAQKATKAPATRASTKAAGKKTAGKKSAGKKSAGKKT